MVGAVLDTGGMLVSAAGLACPRGTEPPCPPRDDEDDDDDDDDDDGCHSPRPSTSKYLSLALCSSCGSSLLSGSSSKARKKSVADSLYRPWRCGRYVSSELY